MKNLLFCLGISLIAITGMLAQKTKSIDLVKSYFTAVDAGEAQKIESTLASTLTAYAPFSSMPLENKGWQMALKGFKEAFPDMKHEIQNIFADGLQVAIQGNFVGTNSGSMMGNPPTGNKVSVGFNTILILDKSNKIKTIRVQFDNQAFSDQLMGINPMVKMNAEKNVREIFALMDAGKVDELAKYCSSDFTISNPFLPSPMPIQAFQGVIQTQKSAFPDMQHQLVDIISNGKAIVTTGIFTGTNTGSLMGNPPTGKKVNIPFIVMDELDASGKIRMRNVQFDSKAFENQLMAGMVSGEYIKSAIKGSYEALNKRDYDRFSSYLSEHTIDYGNPVPTKGKAAVVDFIKEFFTAFPDFKVTVEDIAVSGNKAYVKNTLSATHTQNLMGMIPATGKKIEWSDVDVMEFDQAGKISGHWLQNPNAPLDQIGYHAITNPNTAVVIDAYDKFGKGDVAGIASLCGEMVIWDVADNPQLKHSKIYKGKKEVMQFFGDLMSNSEVIKFEPLRFMADGNEVISINTIEWKNKSTHKAWGATYVHHFKFENGKVVSFKEFSGKPWPIMISASK